MSVSEIVRWAKAKLEPTSTQIETLPSDVPEAMRSFRDMLADKYLSGRGIEIGPGNAPIRFSSEDVDVRYVDHATKEELVGTHHFAGNWTDAEIIDDGEKLSSIPDSSLNFLIACHVLEHTQDPLGVLKIWFAKLKIGGIALIAIPDRRFCFDRDRPLTPFGHLVHDHEKGPAASEEDHLQEWVTLVNKEVDEEVINWQKSEIKRIDYRIHYHVWDTRSFIDLLLHCSEDIVPFDIELAARNDTEVIAVLRKIESALG